MIFSELILSGKKYTINDMYPSSLSPVQTSLVQDYDQAVLTTLNDMRLFYADVFASHYFIYEIRGNYCMVRKDIFSILERIDPADISFQGYIVPSVVSPPPYPRGNAIARGSYEIALRYSNYVQVGYTNPMNITLFRDGTLWVQCESAFNVGYYCYGLKYYFQNAGLYPPQLAFSTSKNLSSNNLIDYARQNAGIYIINPSNYYNNYCEYLDSEIGILLTSPAWQPDQIFSHNIKNQGIPGTSYFVAPRPVIKRGGWRS